MVLQPGDMIGQYRIESQIGSGGMATVYKAYHAKLDRYVAIKMMHQTLSEDPNFHTRFEREARIVARLEHPNIVPIFDFSEHDHNPYLVMKHIEGRTLKTVIRAGAVPFEEVRRITEAVASALDYAHRHGVLHRDVKPSNIILDEKGTPYLTDFGLARIAQAGESTMSADMMLGTPHYISPEQARGDKDIDSRADVYSLGVILYELVTGRVPFSADTAYATVHDHIYTQPPKPSAINPEVTPAVEAVLLRALAKDPQDRYPTATEMIAAFERAAQSSGMESLDPQRVENRVPMESTPKERIPRVPPPPPAPEMPNPIEKPLTFAGQVVRDSLKSAGPELRKAWEEIQAEIKEEFESERGSDNKRDKRQNRTSWRPGTSWKQDVNGNWGFYSEDELREIQQREDISDEERIRRRVEKKFKARNEFLGHLAWYAIINVMVWAIYLWTAIEGGELYFPWPLFVTFGWGIGVVANFFEYNNTYGSGYNRQEEAIQREVERELERSGLSRKAKNDDLYFEAEDDGRGIRLTEDGELTDSYAEEREEKPKRNRI